MRGFKQACTAHGLFIAALCVQGWQARTLAVATADAEDDAEPDPDPA